MIASDRRGLDSQVLLLNRFYMAMKVITARQSFILLCRDAAEVIDVEEGQYFNYSFDAWQELSEFRQEEGMITNWINAARQVIEVPRVLRLTNYDKIPQATIRFSRKNLYLRDNQQCQYCGKQLSFSQVSLDHIQPRSKGGETSWENIVCSCTRCNTHKGCRTPKEARMKLRSTPSKPNPFQVLNLTPTNQTLEAWLPFLKHQMASS